MSWKSNTPFTIHVNDQLVQFKQVCTTRVPEEQRKAQIQYELSEILGMTHYEWPVCSLHTLFNNYIFNNVIMIQNAYKAKCPRKLLEEMFSWDKCWNSNFCQIVSWCWIERVLTKLQLRPHLYLWQMKCVCECVIIKLNWFTVIWSSVKRNLIWHATVWLCVIKRTVTLSHVKPPAGCYISHIKLFEPTRESRQYLEQDSAGCVAYCTLRYLHAYS